jgi:hypothetical protein
MATGAGRHLVVIAETLTEKRLTTFAGRRKTGLQGSRLGGVNLAYLLRRFGMAGETGQQQAQGGEGSASLFSFLSSWKRSVESES